MRSLYSEGIIGSFEAFVDNRENLSQELSYEGCVIPRHPKLLSNRGVRVRGRLERGLGRSQG